MVSLGSQPQTALAQLHGWDAEQDQATIKMGIAAMHRGFKTGFISQITALATMESMGMSAHQALYNIQAWVLERQVDEHVLGASQVLADVASGGMSAVEAGSRLVNMGFNEHDGELLILEAEKKLHDALAKAEKAQLSSDEAARKAAIAARDRAAKEALSADNSARKAAEAAAAKADRAAALATARAAKAAEQLVRQAETARRMGEQQLSKAVPISELNRWLKKGMISQEIYLERLNLMGYPDGVADVMMKEICDGKTAACVATAGPDDAAIADSAAT